MKDKLDLIFDKYINMRIIHKACLNISFEDYSYKNEYNMKTNDNFLLASVSKLFTTSVILNLFSQNKISLEDRIYKFFSDGEINNLNNINGNDYTKEVTIENLLYQNSGFLDPEINLKMGDRIKSSALSFKNLMKQTRDIEGIFLPNSRKSYYSSVNFILLGEIAERIEKRNLSEIFENIIFKPLAMNESYLSKEGKYLPKCYFKNNYIDLSQRVIASKGAGGGVGNSEDLMVFLRAFFEGRLFDKSLIQNSKYLVLPKSFGPIKYGRGYMGIDFNNDRYLGHNGISGSFAFANLEKNLYITGSFNQLAKQSITVDLLEDINGIF